MWLMKQSVNKYLMASVLLQAVCTNFNDDDSNAVRAKTERAVETLSGGMLLGFVGLDYTIRWSCEDYLTSTTEVTEASADATSRTSATSITPVVDSVAPVIGNDTSTNATPTLIGATTSNQERDTWKDEAEELAKQVISAASKNISANTWEKRCKELHPTVTAALDSNLNNLIAKHK
ncbi:hypothetical protein AAVH_21527 [Aphelenchoides avenae]|nr:hypothetical protein AAVH_21527 [Aphelenchus avenae]